ncbi:MAG TPA: SRPBCC family protein [Sphingomonas sp.]|nr:SRPBCC family protein [Sphingomonas sp.]
MSDGIRWLEGYAPDEAPIHVVNTIDAAVPASLVWTRLIGAAGWPAIYANAHDVKVEGGGAELFDGARFTWKTFGVSLKSRVLEFEPETRVAWLATGLGVKAYHAWLITPTPTGCTILTEETQYGLAARAGRLLFPRRMEEWHQKWLEALAA